MSCSMGVVACDDYDYEVVDFLGFLGLEGLLPPLFFLG